MDVAAFLKVKFRGRVDRIRGCDKEKKEKREKEGRRKEGRKEKGKKKSDRDEENKHDSREMLKVRMHSIPRIASLSAEQTRRRRKKRASVECKGRLKMLAPIQRGDFSYSDFVYMLNHHP